MHCETRDMASIVVGSYMIRYPLGGMLSWSLQWLVGLQRLGHDIFFVERAHYPKACFDPQAGLNGDDPRRGIEIVDSLFRRFDLQDRWCFVDYSGTWYGDTRSRVERRFRDADLFLDLGTHGSWMQEAASSRLRVLVDGEPGYTQMKMELRAERGVTDPCYDYYFSNGANLAAGTSSSPLAGRTWGAVFNPVVIDLFASHTGCADDPFTTVMNWQAHDPLTYRGIVYGQKDIEFEKFLALPSRTRAPLEIATSGKVPTETLRQAGWRLRSAQDVTVSFDSYRNYIAASAGEFSVCKQAYVSTDSGWFSDRSAAYLASGRPVVMQETGFSAHLPCGEGLFAVATVADAAAAIDTIQGDYALHSRRAKEIAYEHLSTDRVLPRFLGEIGL